MTMQAHTYLGRASVWRKESYNHGTTAKVEWVVKYKQPDTGNIVIVRECKTRKEALQWANIYAN